MKRRIPVREQFEMPFTKEVFSLFADQTQDGARLEKEKRDREIAASRQAKQQRRLFDNETST